MIEQHNAGFPSLGTLSTSDITPADQFAGHVRVVYQPAPSLMQDKPGRKAFTTGS
jgi:hypothetical protein